MDTLVARMPSQPTPKVWQPWVTLDDTGDDERNCATKELPTARWRRERRFRDKLGDYTKLQQNKTTHDSSTYDSPRTPPLPDVLGTRTHVSTTRDAPLDMTMTRSSRPPPSYSESLANNQNAPARPSVITCAPPASTSCGDQSSDVKTTNKGESGRQGHRRELLSGMCDPVIDEHFRRSLGNDYMNLFSSDSCSTSNNNNTSNGSSSNSSITVTGLSVDDHFAKALGETWVKLQGQTSNSTSSSALVTKESKSSAPSTATVSVSVAKETAPSSATSLLQQRRGLVSI
ncbi:hypothetical protein Cfor_07495 [Coptotermes formosanus]|uniref:Transcription cofactor vestigial-like protein 4 n=1 Tax=Coptotermes formosanus TaxID=36987 RepID=A0A6L2PW13_COPFO|nr:hypothetical protein Cfor_07495 [Coptotermes formosanus]